MSSLSIGKANMKMLHSEDCGNSVFKVRVALQSAPGIEVSSAVLFA